MKNFYRILIIVAAGVFLFSGYKLYSIFAEYRAGINEYADLSQYVRTVAASEVQSDQPKEDMLVASPVGKKQEGKKVYAPSISVDVKSLKEQNPDFVAWLYMPLLGISYPVVQGEDDEYYLHRTFEQKINSNGCIFEGFETSPDFTDYNSFLYGHNMRNGAMFGSLKKLVKQKGLIKSDPYFYLYTEDHVYVYKVYSYYITPPDSDSFVLVDTKQQYQTYIDMVLKRSLEDLGEKPETDQTSVTLSTCSGSGENKKRLLVHGMLIGIR